MRGRTVVPILVAALAAGFASSARAQAAHAPIQSDIYCSGIVTSEGVSQEIQIITGEQSVTKIAFEQGNYVYINKGASQGVKVGDEFLVMRAVKDPGRYVWFKWQSSLSHAMGTIWEDEGRIRVVVAQPNVSIAQVTQSCELMQRGDIVVPFAERPAPPLKPVEQFDRFAPPSGKSKAMVVTAKRFLKEVGTDDVIYVNLGSSQGVKPGDYFRIFRYQGNQIESPYREWYYATAIYGYGSAPNGWKWDNLPREILGEGIVLRTSPNSSTVMITFSLREMFAGDYVEIE